MFLLKIWKQYVLQNFNKLFSSILGINGLHIYFNQWDGTNLFRVWSMQMTYDHWQQGLISFRALNDTRVAVSLERTSDKSTTYIWSSIKEKEMTLNWKAFFQPAFQEKRGICSYDWVIFMPILTISIQTSIKLEWGVA